LKDWSRSLDAVTFAAITPKAEGVCKLSSNLIVPGYLAWSVQFLTFPRPNRGFGLPETGGQLSDNRLSDIAFFCWC